MNRDFQANRKLQMVTLAGVLGVCVVSLLAFGQGVVGYSAPTAQIERRASQPKWEYCAITGIGSARRGLGHVATAQISYFTNAGTRYESIEGGEDNRPVGAAIGKLGAEGWELVGEGTFDFRGTETPSPGVLYFKRPAQ